MPSLNKSASRLDSTSLSYKYSQSLGYSQKSGQSEDIKREPISKQRRRIVFLILACSNVVNSMCLALIAPIFPPIASSKGVNLTVQGWIFGIFALTQCLSSPVFGKLIPHLGAKFTFVWGTIFTSGCCVLFGCLAWIDDTTTFVGFCFLVRIFLALGTVSTNTAVFVIVMIVWPDQVAYMMGTLEALIGIGFMLGPAIAGVFFDIGGFYAPFLVVGIFILILGVTASFALATEAGRKYGASDSKVSMFSLLRSKAVLIVTVSCIGLASTWISLDPTLQPHLEKEFGLSATVVGFVFLIPAMTYAITAPFVGKLVDKLGNSLPVMVFGFMAVGVCFLFFGPSPLFGLENYQELWLNFTSLALFGLTFGFAVVPVYERLITYTRQAGYPDNMETMSAVGALFWSAYSAGDFLGPVLAGALVDYIGFQWCMTIVGSISIVLGLVLLLFWILSRKGKPKHDRTSKHLDVDENLPLIKSDAKG